MAEKTDGDEGFATTKMPKTALHGFCMVFGHWDAENHGFCMVVGRWDAENHGICMVLGHTHVQNHAFFRGDDPTLTQG